MKLPEIDEKTDWNQLTQYDLAQLHCLRSIAVNLEVLTIIHLNQHEKNSDTIKAAKILERHSVSDREQNPINPLDK